MPANPNIFREYDIRGDAARDLNDVVVESIGLCLGTLFQSRGKKQIAVCRDCRESSPAIHAALTRGLVRSGMQLIDIGVGPTPLLYFAVFARSLDGGVQITGSHNPPGDNGMKIMIGRKSFFGDDIRTLRQMVLDDAGIEADGGGSESWDATEAYVERIRDDVQLARKDVRVALDAGNGAGGPLGVRVLEAIGMNPVALLCEMDGAFPVHHPDPTEPENLELLRDTVLNEGLDLGIALDGDADRIGVIDVKGDIIWGDKLMVLLSREVLRKNPGAAILGEVKCSQTMYDDIAAHGGRPILWKTGHSLIKTKMAEEGALLAGEMSGHIFFADRYFGFDDAIYAAARLIEILAETDAPLHALLADVPETFATPELRVPCPDELKFAVVDEVLRHYRGTHEIVDIDGARILFDGGWGLVRASNTQAVLVLRFEASTPERRDEIRREVESVVAAAQKRV